MTIDAAPPQQITADPKNVTEAIARIMGELPAIGKDSSSPNVPYKFRGIETITAHAQALCSKYGVVFYPKGEITEVKDIVVNGKPWTDTLVSVEYEVCHGPSDTSKFMRVPAIGRDNSDKGSNKGMTQAFKYALIQAFMIADPKDDGDFERHETDAAGPARTVHSEPPQRPVAARAATVAANPNLISEKQIKLVSVLFTKKGLPPDRESRHAYANLVIGHEVASVKELTKAEASKLIDALNAEPELDADQAEF